MHQHKEIRSYDDDTRAPGPQVQGFEYSLFFAEILSVVGFKGHRIQAGGYHIGLKVIQLDPFRVIYINQSWGGGRGEDQVGVKASR